jgi:beta-phosphoglucomutase
MEIKACIFDLDGVIVDTAKYHFIAWREIANQLGFEFTGQHNERLKGVSRTESLNILLEIGGVELSNDEKLKLAHQKNQRYVEYIEKMAPDEILPGVLPFLESIKLSNIKTAIGSASKNTPLILERLNLGRFFDVVIDGNSVSKAKPNPEVFIKGAESLNVYPSECIVFEDAEAGVEAALNAGMWCVGIGNKKVLHKAHRVIPGFEKFSLEKLLAITEKWV